MTLRVQRFETLPKIQWRNGGGITYEIARYPAVGEFDWRISVAEIATSGSFSEFPGIDRIIMLADGTEMILVVDGCRHRLRPLEPFAFDGDSNTAAEVTAPTRDLNVMTRRGQVSAELEVLRVNDGERVPVTLADPLLLVGLIGTAALSSANQECVELTQFDAVCWTGPTLTVTGPATVAAVRIRRSSPIGGRAERL